MPCLKVYFRRHSEYLMPCEFEILNGRRNRTGPKYLTLSFCHAWRRKSRINFLFFTKHPAVWSTQPRRLELDFLLPAITGKGVRRCAFWRRALELKLRFGGRSRLCLLAIVRALARLQRGWVPLTEDIPSTDTRGQKSDSWLKS